MKVMNVTGAVLLLSFVVSAVLPCDGAETGETASCEQRAAFEDYRRAWAAERPRIDADIDANRKAPLTVRVVDGAGRPVTNAFVRIEQLTHDFRFGCSILALGQLGRDNAAYEGAFAKLFNHATTTFCLGAIEPVKGGDPVRRGLA